MNLIHVGEFLVYYDSLVYMNINVKQNQVYLNCCTTNTLRSACGKTNWGACVSVRVNKC